MVLGLRDQAPCACPGPCAPTMRARWAEPYPASKLPTLGPVCPKTALSAAIYQGSCLSTSMNSLCKPASSSQAHRQVAHFCQNVAPAHAPASHHGDDWLRQAPDLSLQTPRLSLRSMCSSGRHACLHLQLQHVETGQLVCTHVAALASHTLITPTAEGLVTLACMPCQMSWQAQAWAAGMLAAQR